MTIFNSLNKESLRTTMKLFSSGDNKPRVRLSPLQKQKGSNDCGVFAIGIAVAVAFGLNPSPLGKLFQQRIVFTFSCVVDNNIDIAYYLI